MSIDGEHIVLDDPLLARIGGMADEQGVEAYVVGGYVRDALLGSSDNDVDIVVPPNAVVE